MSCDLPNHKFTLPLSCTECLKEGPIVLPPLLAGVYLRLAMRGKIQLLIRDYWLRKDAEAL